MARTAGAKLRWWRLGGAWGGALGESGLAGEALVTWLGRVSGPCFVFRVLTVRAPRAWDDGTRRNALPALELVGRQSRAHGSERAAVSRRWN